MVPARPRRPCPVCGGTSVAELYQQRFETPERGAALDGYTVVTCVGCGFAFADGVPGQESLDAHYREQSKYEHAHRGGVESAHDRRRFVEVARRFSEALPDRSVRVLDVGCATGGFLSVLTSLGYRRVLGLDPSPACAELAGRVHGVEVETCRLGELPPRRGRFEVVALLAVLEHVRDLAAFLAEVSEALTEEGRIYVQVPDAGRFHAFTDAPFQQFSTEHINFFSRPSLVALLHRCGFRLERAFEDVVEDAGGATPVVEAVFARGALPAPPPRDHLSAEALEEYVRICGGEEQRVRSVLAALARRGSAVLVWGAGTHTQHLLAAGAFDGVSIAAFVDSNPHLAGTCLRGRPILSPNEVHLRAEPIVVSSRGFQREITAQIRDVLRLGNEVITLYPIGGQAR